MIKVLLSESEKNKLIEKIEKEKNEFPKRTLLALMLFILFIFIPGKNHRPSYYSEYGFLKPALITTILVIGFCYSDYKSTMKALKSDLDSGEKIVKDTIVWKKEKSFTLNKYCIYTDNDHKPFSKFDIEEEAYNKIEKGHIVKLEYAEKSKFLYQLNLNL
jgi:hypothetical protein